MKNSYFLRAMALVAILFTFALNLKAQTYPLSDSQLAAKIAAKQQLTDVPTIYIDIPDLAVVNNFQKEDGYKRATFQYVDNSDPTKCFIDDGLSIKVRGNATSQVQILKKAYRLKFDKDVKDASGNVIQTHKHDLLGRGYSKRNWVLLANAFDKSMLRNALTYHINKAVGMAFCPGYKFVDVVINNDYRGTYQISDHPEVGSNRVEIDEDKDWMMEFVSDGRFVEDPYIPANGNKPTMNINIKSPDYDSTVPAEAELLNTLKTDITNWSEKWYNAFSSSAWKEYNDVESFINFYIINQLTLDYDGWMTIKNYRSPDGPLFWGPVWDKDLAYGNYRDDTEILVENLQNGQLRTVFENYGSGLDHNYEFVAMVKEKYDKVLAAGLKTTLNAALDQMSAEIQNTQAQNYKKWGYGALMGELYHSNTDYSYYVTQLRSFINNRIDWLEGKFDAMYNDCLSNISDFTYNPDSYAGDWNYFNKWVNATVVNRNLYGNKWNPICLPFDLTQSKLEEALGCTYELKTHTRMDVDGETMIFETPTSLNVEAGMPYLIKPAKDVSNILFEKVLYASYQNGSSWDGSKEAKSITFDNKHYFKGLMYWQKGLSLKADYVFNNDVYIDNSSMVIGTKAETWDTSAALSGARAYVTVPEGTVPLLSIVSGSQPTERTQLTNLPTIYIDTQDGAQIEPSTGNYIHAKMQIIDANGTLSQDTEEFDYMEIRGRGTDIWTGTDKKSYRIKFAKQHKHDLMGKGYSKRNWALLANAGDKSLMRNALTNELGTAIGMPFTPGYCFVDLVLNDEYVGTYQVSDQIQADANRVNINEDTGWLVEMTKEANVSVDDVYVEGSDNMPWIVVNNPEYANYTDQEAFKATVSEFVTNLLNDNSGAYIDLTSFVNWYIATEILGGYQSLSDIYAYKENAAETLSFGPLWNNDFSFNNSSQIDMSGNGLMSDLNNDESFNGLVFNAAENSVWKAKLATLWQQEWFKQAVLEKWNQIYTGANSGIAKTLIAKVEAMANTLNQSQALNFSSEAGGAGWTLTGQGVTGVSRDNTFNFANYTAAVAQLKTYIQERLPYLDRKFNALANAQQQQFVAVNYEVDKQAAQTFYNEYVGEQADVTILNRKTIQGGEWNAITFPFNASRDVINDVFGADCQLRALSSVQTVSAQNIVFTFEEVTGGVEAGVPYIIYPSSDVTNLTFNGVDFDCSFAQTVEKDGYLLVGTLQPTDIKADNRTLIFSTANKLLKLNQDTQINGARAYITIPESASNANSFSIGIEEADGIKVVGVEANKNNGYIYNINGQLVGKTMKNMPKGVYVVNGRKVIK